MAARSGPPHRWLKPAVFVGALFPLFELILRALTDRLTADPVAFALNRLGLVALIFLVAGIACTPVKFLTGWTWPIRIRRMLGLYAMFYASLHFLTYVVIDQSLDFGALLKDIAKRPFITVGFLALVLMIPLAVTSTNAMVKRLGFPRWKRLHRLSYVVTALAVIHFVWRVKKDKTEPFIYGFVVAVLLLLRVVEALKDRQKKARRVSTA